MTLNRLLLIALFTSIAVNVFVGGLVVGRWIEGGWDRPGAVQRADVPDGPAPRWLRRALGKEGAPALRRVWDRHRYDIHPLVENAKAARIAVANALAAEPFDAEAYAMALEGLRARLLQLHTATHVAMIDLVEDLPPELRKRIADRARRWGERVSPPDPESRRPPRS